MAPIAISPHEQQNVEVLIKRNISQYKEQSAGPLTYNKQSEEEGSDKAKVSWFREFGELRHSSLT